MSVEVESNPRGIPKAPFVDEVEKFVNENVTAESLLTTFDNTLSQYKRMEANLRAKKQNLKNKIPELKSSLDAIVNLINQAETSGDSNVQVEFELNDQMFASATIKKPVLEGENQTRVGVWLGANVMVEYSLSEAKQLLSEKINKAQSSLKVVSEDLEFLREQITVLEVNIARVYNYDVKQRLKK